LRLFFIALFELSACPLLKQKSSSAKHAGSKPGLFHEDSKDLPMLTKGPSYRTDNKALRIPKCFDEDTQGAFIECGMQFS
jgi:hypothetical protein